MSDRVRRGLRAVVAAAVGVALLWWVIPHISHTTWSAVWGVLSAVPADALTGLCVLWIVGLLAHTFVLTGALPGLSHKQALTLNLTGSAVSNIAPMGGALGVATNLRMTRQWRMRDSSFATFTIITNIWDVIAKLLLPFVALVALAVHGDIHLPSLRAACIVASVLIAVLLAVIVAWLANERAAPAVERTLARAAAHLPAGLPERLGDVEQHLAEVRHQSRDIVRRNWHSMTAGMVAYLTLQAVLLWFCLHLVGVDVAVATLLVAFALERLGTLAVVTPGGIGFGEAATLAALVALGSPGLQTAAGLLLFRVFTYLIEIPVGGLWLGGWLLAHQERTA